MDTFEYRNGQLCCEEVPLARIAEEFGTPTYVYSRDALEQAYLAYAQALEGHKALVCYAVKANSNLAVLNVLARLGAGFDIVSVGELERVLHAGGDASKVVFSGVGKQPAEIRRALEVGIRCFNIESEAELERVNDVAAAEGKVAEISFRVNPDVDAGTHPYISTGLKENKFGIDIDEAVRIYSRAAAAPSGCGRHGSLHGYKYPGLPFPGRCRVPAFPVVRWSPSARTAVRFLPTHQS